MGFTSSAKQQLGDDMNVILRAEALALGLQRYFTGKPCVRGHISERATSHKNCLECRREKSRKWVGSPGYLRWLHADKTKEKKKRWNSLSSSRAKKRRQDAAYRTNNEERRRKKDAAYYAKNRYAISGKQAARYAKNAESVKERSRRWRKENPARVCTNTGIRRARVFDASANLTEADRAQIDAIYRLRDEMTKTTGVEHHVDHIVPLSRGGKHHQNNLRVITGEENRRKGAKLCVSP